MLSAKTIESDRIEFKEGWNPDTVYRSICAFANDFDNIGAGYVLLGVAENPLTNTALRPVKGLTTKQIGDIQKEMIGFNNLLKPFYAPRLFIEEVDDRQIIVLWVNGGSERPYEVPETITSKHKTWKYFIRKYASSIEAKGAEKQELISLSNNIPFDDRVNTRAQISDISMLRLQDYLRKVNSKLANEVGERSNTEILNQMALVSGPNENIFPRNVALMLFTEAPHHYFPYTWVEIINFPKGVGAKEFTEKKIEGPVHQQIIDTLSWLQTNFLQQQVTKLPYQAEAVRTWNYPYSALEEAVANCLYHRNYQEREPVKIRVEPNSIVIYNCGGPDRSIKREDLASGIAIPKRYRNRRLGDFLKELKLTEGHATGIPAIRKAMLQNGSPEPVFDFDEERTWFQISLPVHNLFRPIQTLTLDLNVVKWDIIGVDRIVNEILENVSVIPSGNLTEVLAGGIAGGIAENIDVAIADYVQSIELQLNGIITQVDSTTASGIASGIAGGIDNKWQEVLKMVKKPMSRAMILKDLNLSNHAKNFENYIQPLVALNWLTMTIPNKPTSPKQQYLTTLKGRLILEFLKFRKK